MTDQALVSVVIPTHARPGLVGRSVASALAQTERRIEVIVVVDGADPATMAALGAFSDDRLRTLVIDSHRGAQAARNAGIGQATARWLALLDDDDEWLPTKLEVQLRLAEASGYRLPVVSCRLFTRTRGGAIIRPRRLPGRDEPVSEYLAVRHNAFHGEGLLITSTLLAPTELFRLVPFTEGVGRFQDFDWAIHASTVPGVGFVSAPEPLAIWHEDEDRHRISHTSGWRQTYDWVRSNRRLFTRRAYAAAMTGLVSSMAVETRDPRVFALLLREATRRGKPTPVEIVTFLQVWLIPGALRRGIRELMTSGLRREPPP